jgi:hypothetical protein
MISTLEAFTNSPTRATELAKEHLTLAGWMVVEPSEDIGDFDWERPSDFYARLKISHSQFYRRLHHPGCPRFMAQRGPTGRITKMKSNFQLDRWMQKK